MKSIIKMTFMKSMMLCFCVASLSLSRFLIADTVNDKPINIDQIYEKSLSPDGKFGVARVETGRDEVETYFINEETKKLMGKISYISPKDNIYAIWNKDASKVALLIEKGKIGEFLEIFTLDLHFQFKQITFNLPKVIESNYKKSEKDPSILFRCSVCDLGTWIDDNTVTFMAGNYYEKDEGDPFYLTSFNVHITKNGKAEVQNVKVIGSLSMEEYETFKATHNYQFE